MYNFLDSKLLPKVSTTSPSMDNYEASNLISDNTFTKSRGFLAYTSIKPPVDLDFQLITPISINYITISTTLGTQRSSGIEIFAKNKTNQFVSLGSAIFSEAGVTFSNARYYCREKIPDNTNKDYYLGFFRRNEFRVFLNANEVRIRIFRTEKSVPCISSVEIWGKVSKNSSPVTVQTINKLMNKEITTIEKKNCSSHYSDKFDLLNEKASFEIPDEFKDALTYEIMALPMTLPSGHTIDQSTLERCIEVDASNGRQGMDPFTGVSFASNINPVLNIALKSRIDMFLLRHSDKVETHKLKRTLGKRVLGKETVESVPSSSKETVENLPSTSKELVENDSNFKSTVVSKKIKYNPTTSSSSQSDELDDLIRKASEQDNFVCYLNSQEKSVDSEIKKCCKCKELLNLYKLPCNDLYCKPCLLIICSNYLCIICNKAFKRELVEKINL